MSKRVAGGLVAACLATGLAGAAPAGAADFCSPRVVHDYLKPLRGMPDLRGLPDGQRLPFKPSGVFIGGGLETRELQAGAGSIGYHIGYGRPSPRLNWLVTAKAAQVDRDGDVRRLVGARQAQIRRPDPEESADLTFLVSGKLALYRVELTIRKLSGELLGRFGKYVRVVRPRVDARLALNASAYRPGEVVQAQVENYGTAVVRYGVPYSIERYDGATWSIAPESPDGPWMMPLYASPAGSSGYSCLSFRIPGTMPAGTYRMVKEVEYEADFPKEATAATLTTEFQVAP